MSALDRREVILAAACGFFADVGFAGTTRALADSLGVRQALLYRYFPSKEALVEAVFQRVFMQRWTRDFAAVLADRSVLEDRVAEFTDRFGDGPVPRPPHWGGYRLVPDLWEFWQGRKSRLHDRLRYRLHPFVGADPHPDAVTWLRERLAP